MTSSGAGPALDALITGAVLKVHPRAGDEYSGPTPIVRPDGGDSSRAASGCPRAEAGDRGVDVRCMVEATRFAAPHRVGLCRQLGTLPGALLRTLVAI